MENKDPKITSFRKRRAELKDLMENYADLEMKRFLNIDTQVYQKGELDVKTKELLGLVSSTVLRCDDCISYHLIRCKEEGLGEGELREAMSIAMVVGGSITIPHVRRVFEMWNSMED